MEAKEQTIDYITIKLYEIITISAGQTQRLLKSRNRKYTGIDHIDVEKKMFYECAQYHPILTDDKAGKTDRDPAPTNK